MKRERFLSQRQPEWQAFEDLLNQLRKTRQARWSSDALGEFSRMYRSICYDLSLVRSREWGDQLERYLNRLVAQGHNFLYRAPPRNLWTVVDFLTAGFPVLLRKHQMFFWAALGLFALPFAVAMVGSILNPAMAESVLPAEQLEAAGEMYSGSLYDGIDDQYARDRSAMAGFYVFNNVGIAFRCFALGAFFGIGTIHQLLLNGLFLGAISGYIIQLGHADNFCSFVIAHGSFELTALVIAGASGLLLGWGMIHPGQRTRAESLRYYGMESVKLIAGAGVMLGIAALIEAFFSPLAIPHVIKYVVGSGLWIFVICWLTLAGRGRSVAP